MKNKERYLEALILSYKPKLEKSLIEKLTKDIDIQDTDELVKLIAIVTIIAKEYIKHFGITEMRYGEIKEKEE